MNSEKIEKKRDLQTLVGILRGPGNYPTPSVDRINRLMRRGLLKKKVGTLRVTVKGRIIALFCS